MPSIGITGHMNLMPATVALVRAALKSDGALSGQGGTADAVAAARRPCPERLRSVRGAVVVSRRMMRSGHDRHGRHREVPA